MFDDFSSVFMAGKRTDRINENGHVPIETGGFPASFDIVSCTKGYI